MKNEQNIILNYVKENKEILKNEEKEFLIRYAASKTHLNSFETYNVDKNNFLRDLKNLSKHLTNSQNTPLVANRMVKIIQLFENFESEMEKEKLLELSIELDKLFLESGLDVRNTNTVLEKIKKRDKSNER